MLELSCKTAAKLGVLAPVFPSTKIVVSPVPSISTFFDGVIVPIPTPPPSVIKIPSFPSLNNFNPSPSLALI